MTESMLLALVAAAAGLVLARWGVAVFVALAPAGLPRLSEIGIDWRVIAFAPHRCVRCEHLVRRSACRASARSQGSRLCWRSPACMA
jgi:hypothetical protein